MAPDDHERRANGRQGVRYRDPGWRYLGNIGLHNIDYVSGVAEAGIVIGVKEYWGQGTEQTRPGLFRFAFREMRMRKIILKVFGTNIRAQRAYAKIGFKG